MRLAPPIVSYSAVSTGTARPLTRWRIVDKVVPTVSFLQGLLPPEELQTKDMNAPAGKTTVVRQLETVLSTTHGGDSAGALKCTRRRTQTHPHKAFIVVPPAATRTTKQRVAEEAATARGAQHHTPYVGLVQ